jgi:hypothetical protein
MGPSVRLFATCLILAVSTVGCTVTDPNQNAAANSTGDQLPTGSHLHHAAGSSPSNVTNASSVNNIPVQPSGQ